MSNHDGVIFDKDGVLLDSGLNNFHWKDKARVKAAQKKDIELTLDQSIQIVEASTIKEIEEFLQDTGMTWKDLKQIEKSVEETKIELIKQGVIWLFPEAKNTLESINQTKALATNAPRKATNYTLSNFEIEQHFSNVKATSINDIKQYFRRKKPNRVMLEEIMDENNLENPLMVGDTRTDIKAAANAGIDSVHVLNYSNSASGKADYEVDNISQLKNIV